MKEAQTILVAEDLPNDVLLLQQAFSKAGLDVPLHFVRDGQEAIDYLNGEQSFADRATHPMPTLLLLDLNMPRLNGFDVLKWLRRQEGLRRLPVVVFTSSSLPQDVNRAYDLGANSFLVKPHGFIEYQQAAQNLESYWLRTNQYPECRPAQTSGFAPRRVLLQDLDSGQYSKGPGTWTAFPREALDFLHTDEAIERARELGMKNAQIVWAYEDELKTVRVQGGFRI